MTWRPGALLLAALQVAAAQAWGDEAEDADDADAAGADDVDDAPAPAPDPRYQTTVEGPPGPTAPGRAESAVSGGDAEARGARSAPDALRWEPGVYVQQTSAGQGSPFLRGRTGQQTLLLFDGIRLNHSLFRAGPNQYFFTVDLRSVERIDVVRGGAASRWGSDAIGGVLNARPVEPAPGAAGWRAGLTLRATSADDERGGRVSAHWQALPRLALVGGVGVRRVGLLESGGAVRSPVTGQPALVPRLDDDGHTQLGTGFDELASDVRLVWRPAAGGRVTLAAYDYRQLDAPRTDQCPPPEAPVSECLSIDELFRTLVYAAWEGPLPGGGFFLFTDARATLSLQRSHERRTRARPSVDAENGGRDDVTTAGATLVLRGAPRPTPLGALRARWGLDAYVDRVDSAAWTIFTDVGLVRLASRGQYLDGSRYLTGGMFAEADLRLPGRLMSRVGSRLGLASADAPADPESGTRAVDASWWSSVYHWTLAWDATAWLALALTYDRSYRAPNLDDLTARQSVGPGYQFENADLRPEEARSWELSARLSLGPVRLDGWLYQSDLTDAIQRAPRDAAECPPGDATCAASRTRFQLVNLDDEATIRGAEAALALDLPPFDVRAVVSYAWGEGPVPGGTSSTVRVPLSRIPPLNGNAEVRLREGRGTLALGLRWARAQTRLAVQDLSDPRVPQGGTPGFAVVDVRAAWQLPRRARVGVVLENVGDAAYRYHGSSINGPGRGILVTFDAEI